LHSGYDPSRSTQGREVDPLPSPPGPDNEQRLRHHLLRTLHQGRQPAGDELQGRTWLLYNADLRVAVSDFDARPGRLVRAGGADELHFVHQGGGRLESVFGVLDYRAGDYVVV